MVPPDNEPPPVRFLAAVDPLYADGVTEQNEYVEEQKAIAAIVARAPEELRAHVQAAMRQNGSLVGSNDAEIAWLMSRIATIRAMRTERMHG